MSIVHAKSVTVADFTGTVTAFNSQGSTTTVAASDLARPSDWNSGHNQLYTLSGNTAGNSTVSGTNVIWQGCESEDSDAFQQFALNFYKEAAQDIHATLIKK